MILAPTSTGNNRGGNGKYRPLRKRSKKASGESVNEFTYLDKFDTRMRFNSSQDPIYSAFEYLEQRSVTELALDFVKDSFFEIANFVSKVTK